MILGLFAWYTPVVPSNGQKRNYYFTLLFVRSGYLTQLAGLWSFHSAEISLASSLVEGAIFIHLQQGKSPAQPARINALIGGCGLGQVGSKNWRRRQLSPRSTYELYYAPIYATKGPEWLMDPTQIEVVTRAKKETRKRIILPSQNYKKIADLLISLISNQ